MSNSTPNLDLIATSQAQKEVTANALFDAASPATLFGRRALTSAALTWGYYGGVINVAGTLTLIGNGTVSLTASVTNYVEASSAGLVTANSTAFTAGSVALYEVVTDADSATSYSDWRVANASLNSVLDAELAALAGLTSAADRIPYFTGSGTADLLTLDTDDTLAADSDTALATQKAIKAYITAQGFGTGSGTVTSVAQTVPEEFSISGSPITGAGTLAITKADQGPNTVWAGPVSGADDTPEFRALVQADLPVQPFDVHAFYSGLPTASAKVLRVPLARAVAFVGNFAGSYFSASANATASTVFTVEKNGSSIGTVTIAAGTITATFASTGGAAQTLAAGDLLSITAPATPDSTLADPGFVLAGTR